MKMNMLYTCWTSVLGGEYPKLLMIFKIKKAEKNINKKQASLENTLQVSLIFCRAPEITGLVEGKKKIFFAHFFKSSFMSEIRSPCKSRLTALKEGPHLPTI